MNLLLVCGLVAALDAQAQSAVGPPAFASGVDSVYLDVVVSSGGRPVTGLSAADFEVRDNGVRQAASLNGITTTGLTVALVFDTSASVAGEKLGQLKAAGHAFIDGLATRDEASLLTFSQELLLPVPPTRDRLAVHRALDRVVGRGATSLRDALYVAVKLRRTTARSLVVLFTDGEDTLSWLTAEEVLAAARQADAQVTVVVSAEASEAAAAYRATIRLPDPLRQEQGAPASQGWERGASRDGEERPQNRFLREIARVTGGGYWSAHDADLPRVYQRILEETRTRYVLSFEPQGVSRPGRHRLEVSVKNRRVDVRARAEYWQPAR